MEYPFPPFLSELTEEYTDQWSLCCLSLLQYVHTQHKQYNLMIVNMITDEVKGVAQETRDEIAALTAIRSSLALELLNANTALSTQKAEVTRLEKELSQEKEQRENIDGERMKLEEKVKYQEEEIKSLSVKVEERDVLVRKIEEERDLEREERAKAEGTVVGQKTVIEELEKSKRELEEEVKELDKSKRELEKDVNELQGEIGRVNDEIQKLRNEAVHKMTNSKAVDSEETKELKIALEKLRAELEASTVELNNLKKSHNYKRLKGIIVKTAEYLTSENKDDVLGAYKWLANVVLKREKVDGLEPDDTTASYAVEALNKWIRSYWSSSPHSKRGYYSTSLAALNAVKTIDEIHIMDLLHKGVCDDPKEITVYMFDGRWPVKYYGQQFLGSPYGRGIMYGFISSQLAKDVGMPRIVPGIYRYEGLFYEGYPRGPGKLLYPNCSVADGIFNGDQYLTGQGRINYYYRNDEVMNMPAEYSTYSQTSLKGVWTSNYQLNFMHTYEGSWSFTLPNGQGCLFLNQQPLLNSDWVYGHCKK